MSTNATAIAQEATARQQAITAAVNALLNGVGPAYDTLKELADKLASDDTALAGLLTALSDKLAISQNLADLGNKALALQNLGAAYNEVINITGVTAYTVTVAQRGKALRITTGASDVALTLPPAASAGNGWIVLIGKADPTATGRILVNGTILAAHTLQITGDGTSLYNRLLPGTLDASGNLKLQAAGDIQLAAGGNVDFGGKKQLNVANGTAATDGTNKAQLDLKADANLAIYDLDFGNPAVDAGHTYLEASTLTTILKSAGIATISYSRNGAAFVQLSAGTTSLSIAAGDAFLWRATYNATYTSGSLTLKHLLS